jgi:hypothetical protein
MRREDSAMRPELTARLRRLAISLAPLVPIAVTIVTTGKRW